MVDGLDGTIKHSHQFAVAADDGTVYSSFQLKTFEMKPSSIPKAMILRKDKNTLADATKTMQEIVRNRYVYQKALLDEVVYNILYTASDKPLKERVNFRMLDQDIRTELINNGINIPYHLTVSTTDGREVFRCPDYTDEGKEFTYQQYLFQNDPRSKMGVVRIHFPEMNWLPVSDRRIVLLYRHLRRALVFLHWRHVRAERLLSIATEDLFPRLRSVSAVLSRTGMPQTWQISCRR